MGAYLLFDLGRGLRQRVTFDPGDDLAPVWSKPEGDRLFFSSRRQGSTHLYERALRGAGEDTLLFEDSLGKYASSLSPDGRFLAYVRGGGIIRRSDVWMLPLAGERRAVPLLQAEFVESQPQFSPDGQWLAYMTNESGRQEVYIRPFARDGDKVQVSTAGGGWARWRRDGKEIFYFQPEPSRMAVEIATERGFEAGVPRKLFETPLGRGSDAPYTREQSALSNIQALCGHGTPCSRNIFGDCRTSTCCAGCAPFTRSSSATWGNRLPRVGS